MSVNGFVKPTSTFEQFVALHKLQLEKCGIPKKNWRSLYIKITDERFDAGLDFCLMRVEYEDTDELGWKVVVSNPDGVKASDENSVYLVDHAWTYNTNTAKAMLQSVNGLLERMCTLMDIDKSNLSDTDAIKSVLRKLWQFNQTYSVSGLNQAGTEYSMPVWYVLDEFGSRIQHSDEPTIRMSPFFNSLTGSAYSIFWLVKDLQLNDEVTRDYAAHVPVDEELERLAHLLPWNACDFTELDEAHPEVDDSYFKISRFDDIDMNNAKPEFSADHQFLVWTSDPLVEKTLSGPRFKLTDNRDKADIIWQNGHIRDFKELSSRNVYLNQFPYEALLTVKDLLAIVSRRAAPTGHLTPRWLPLTYNLNTELPEFICYFQKNSNSSRDNHWICKPWNLGRGLGHVVTDNIECMVRLPESCPYIACKYIENPVLFSRPDGISGVKFDYRYMVLLKSVKPLKLSCYKKFFIRFANKPFSLDDLDDIEKHFTVHNYTNPERLLNINCEEFIPQWDQQYPENSWQSVEAETLECIKELFETVVSEDPPRGIPNYPQSRGQYGIDLMLKWQYDEQGNKTMVPQILEVNFISDCTRACENYPDYFNDIFSALFIHDANPHPNEVVIM